MLEIRPTSRRAALALRRHLEEGQIDHRVVETEYSVTNNGLPRFELEDDSELGEQLARDLSHLGLEVERKDER